jgi:hypothetical protein
MDNMGMNEIDINDLTPERQKVVRKALDEEEGKGIAVDFGGFRLIADYRCMLKDTDACEACKLQFKCYTCTYLIIKIEELQPKDENMTFGEKVQAYVDSYAKEGGRDKPKLHQRTIQPT